jgi:hypothetical protein
MGSAMIPVFSRVGRFHVQRSMSWLRAGFGAEVAESVSFGAVQKAVIRIEGRQQL